MDMYKLNWTTLQFEIFRLFCIKAGQKLNMRNVSKLLKVTPTAVSKSLPAIEKQGLIKINRSKTMNLLLIELNRDNKKTIELKRVENLRMIYESKLSDYLYNEFPGGTIILFGSYSRGEDAWIGESEEIRSDIDIAIVGKKEKKINLETYEKILEKKIIINYYDSWGGIHKQLKNNILNGILLSGGIEL
jgi:predicted nucleotidyltransferase